MRTVLCSTTAGRGVLLLALVAGSWIGLAGPASAAGGASTGPKPQAHHADSTRPGTPVTETSRQSRRGETRGVTVLGPAVKYVRLPDGTIRKVR